MSVAVQKITDELDRYIGFMNQQGRPISKLYLRPEQLKKYNDEVKKNTLGTVFEKNNLSRYRDYPIEVA